MQDKAVQYLPVVKLTCKPQVRERFDGESLAGLGQTIKETGILEPLLVRRDGSEFVVLEGERRLRAAKMAKLTHVPVIVDDRELTEGEVVYRQLVVNCSRDGLEPLEKARAIRRLIEITKWPASQVAVKLGMSPGTVSKLLALLTLPETVQQRVSDGALGLTAAYALSQAPDAETQDEIANEAASERLTRDAVVKRTREWKTKRRTAGGQKRSRSNGHIVLAIGEGWQVKAPARATIQALASFLSAFLKRIGALDRMDMELAEAAKALQGDGG